MPHISSVRIDAYGPLYNRAIWDVGFRVYFSSAIEELGHSLYFVLEPQLACLETPVIQVDILLQIDFKLKRSQVVSVAYNQGVCVVNASLKSPGDMEILADRIFSAVSMFRVPSVQVGKPKLIPPHKQAHPELLVERATPPESSEPAKEKTYDGTLEVLSSDNEVSGQVVLEYVLLLIICIGLATLFTQFVSGSELKTFWTELLNVIGSDPSL